MTSVARLAQALEQATASSRAVLTPKEGMVLTGGFQDSELTGYQIGAAEWLTLAEAVKEVCDADS